MTITIKPQGERYVVRRGKQDVGYILFRAGSQPWVVCDLTDEEVSAHTYMTDARAAAKRTFAA